MGRSLQNRVERLVKRLGDPDDFMTRVQAMRDEELRATIRRLLLGDGYDPTLPHVEAQARYIEKLEAELPAMGEQEQGWQLQILGHLKQDLDDLRLMFPESPPPVRTAASARRRLNPKPPAHPAKDDLCENVTMILLL